MVLLTSAGTELELPAAVVIISLVGSSSLILVVGTVDRRMVRVVVVPVVFVFVVVGATVVTGLVVVKTYKHQKDVLCKNEIPLITN